MRSRSSWLVVALSIALGGGPGCKSAKSESDGVITVSVELGAGFDTNVITGLLIVIDGAAGAGLDLAATVAAEGYSVDGHRYTSQVTDCDLDGVNEHCITFAGNPFSGGKLQHQLKERWPESVTFSIRCVVQMQGSRREVVTKEALDDGTPPRFVAGQTRAVTCPVQCRPGFSCAVAPASLALSGTTPASPSNTTAILVRGTAETTWTVNIYSRNSHWLSRRKQAKYPLGCPQTARKIS